MPDLLSDQLTAIGNRTIQYPNEEYMKMRQTYFSFTAAAAATTPNTIGLFNLPFGRVRVLPHLSRFTVPVAIGTGALLDLGNDAYVGQDTTTGKAVDVSAVAAEYAADIDIAAGVTTPTAWAATLKKDFFSKGGIQVMATISEEDLAVGDRLDGFCVFGQA